MSSIPIVIKSAGFDQFADPLGGSYIKCLIMGDHGVGKTPSAACWPKPIIADCEKGVMSVASKGTPYAEITSSDDMASLIQMLRLDAKKAPENRNYQTLIIDTIDTYQRKIIQERLFTEKKESLSGWADWGWLDAKMQQLMEAILSLPMNVVVNMHTKDVSEEDGDESRLVTKARLKGDIKDAIFQDFDLIGRMEQSYVAAPDGPNKGERVRVRQIRWHSEPKYPSLRDRSNKLPRFTTVDFTENDYFRIFNAITSGLDEIPETKVLETIATEADAAGDAPSADLQGGPVADPPLPRTKATKKTAAKKTVAKKTAAAAEPEPAATEPEAPVETTPEPAEVEREKAPGAADQATTSPDAVAAEQAKGEDPWAPEDDASSIDPSLNGKGTADQPIVLPEDVSMATEARSIQILDHVHTSDGQCRKNTFGAPCDVTAAAEALGATSVTEEPAEAPVAEEKPVEPAAKPAAAAAGARLCGDQPDSMKHLPAVPGCGTELTKANAARMQIAMLKKKTFLCDACHSAADAA